MNFLHLWARNSSFLSRFSQANDIYSCMYRPDIQLKLCFLIMRIARAQLWTRGSVTIRQCHFIFSSRYLKLITGFREIDLFKIFRNRLCINKNKTARALHSKLRKTIWYKQEFVFKTFEAKMLNATSIKVNLTGIVSNGVCLVGKFYCQRYFH